jgi:hypothetical protein
LPENLSDMVWSLEESQWYENMIPLNILIYDIENFSDIGILRFNPMNN